MTAYDPILTSAPAVLPVSLAECKMHLRVDGTDEDSLIGIYLAAAVSHLDGEDGWLGRAIVAQTWAQSFDGFLVADASGAQQLVTSNLLLPGAAFQCSFLLGLSPVTAVSSVRYYDAGGVLQMVDPGSYVLLNGDDAPEVRFNGDFTIPTVRDDKPAVTVTFVAGYGDDTDAPAAIKAAILLMVGDMFQNREGKVEGRWQDNTTVQRLLDPYRRAWMA